MKFCNYLSSRTPLLFSNRTRILATLGVALLFYYPILYAGSFYADDIYRISVSNKGFIWGDLGRFFSEWIAYGYSGNSTTIIDPYPLGLILSILLIGLSGCVISVRFDSIIKSNSNIGFFLGILFVINPFFTENLLYRFDSLGMSLSILFSSLAFYLLANKSKCYCWPVGAIFSVAALFVSLNFYQPSINLFLSLLFVQFLLLVILQKSWHTLATQIGVGLAAYFAASLLYFLECKFFTKTTRGSTVDFSISGLFDAVNNLYKADSVIWKFWSFFPNFIIPLLVVATILVIIRLVKKPASAFGLLIGLLGLSVSSLGILCLLKEGIFPPRTIPIFSCLTMALYLLLAFSKLNFRFLIVLPLTACFIFNYRVGNMHKIQTEFEMPIIYDLAEQLNRQDETIKFYSIGAIPYSPFVKNLISYTPFNGFLSRSSWLTVGRVQQYVEKNKLRFEWFSKYKVIREEFFKKKKANQLELIFSNPPFYKLYHFQNTGYIEWLHGPKN